MAPMDRPRRRLLTLRDVPHALIAVLLAGAVLRIALSLAYGPAYATSYDTVLFLEMAGGELFSDSTRPVGYPLFLRAIHAISDQLELTIAIQHLLGLVTAALMYGLVRRLEAPGWVAVAVAAAVALPLDQIFLEHILRAEAAFSLALVAALYASVRALEDPRVIKGALTSRIVWLATAGLALGACVWLRSMAVLLIPFLGLWLVFALPGPRARRFGGAAAAVATSSLVVIAYMALSSSYTGAFTVSEATGWATYSRTAPFADCSRFEPPAGTERLCETTPTDERPGPDFYGWQPGSPARILYGGPPAGNDQLSAFSVEALLHQPLSYAKVVARDLIRYYHPKFSPQDFSGYDYGELSVEIRLPEVEPSLNRSMNGYYADDELHFGDGLEALGTIQEIIRLHPKLLLIATLFAVIGVFLAKGRQRSGLVLLLGTSVLLLVIPPATAIWSSRYAIPAGGPLIAAGLLGLLLIINRRRDRPSEASV